MSTVSEVAVQYRARGAQAVQRADQNVRDSIQTTADTARQEAGTINRWMQRHRTALLGIGAAATAAMTGIIRSSPILSAQLAEVRLGFSLLAQTIGRDVAPTTSAAGDMAIGLADAYSDLPGPVRSVASHLTFFGGILATVAAGAGALSQLIAGQALIPALKSLGKWLASLGKRGAKFARMIGSRLGSVVRMLASRMAYLGRVVISRLVGGLTSLASTVAGTSAATLAFAGAVGAIIGLAATWVLKTTGVLDAVRNLGSTVRSVAGGGLVDFALALSGILTLGLLPLIAAFGGFVSGILEGDLQSGLDKAQKALEAFSDPIMDLIDNALGWGSDLIDEFVKGIQNKIPSLKDVMKGVENTVSNTLSFDIAVNDRMAQRWGSDMIDHFARGVEAQEARLETALPNPGQATGLASTATPPPSSGGGETTINITLERGAVQAGGVGAPDRTLDERQVAEETANVFDERTSGRGRL